MRVAVPTDCESCGGSENQRSTAEFLVEARTCHVRRVVVVGGTPTLRTELGKLLGGALELRLTDGTGNRDGRRARADVGWSDLVLVCGKSELDHRISNLYTEGPASERHKIVNVARGGIAAILDGGTRHLRLQRAEREDLLGSSQKVGRKK